MTVALVLLTCLVAAGASAALGAPLVATLLRRIEPAAPTPGLLRGGMWVGVLERLMVTAAFLLGEPAAVAAVIAVKGLGRYPELRDTAPEARSEASERFIIGTLASLLWAGAVGVAGRAVILALS